MTRKFLIPRGGFEMLGRVSSNLIEQAIEVEFEDQKERPINIVMELRSAELRCCELYAQLIDEFPALFGDAEFIEDDERIENQEWSELARA